MDLAKRLFKGDLVIWIIFMFLCLISVVEVFSATSTIAYRNANYWAPIVRHSGILLGGFGLVLVLHNFHYKVFRYLGYFIVVAIFLLIITPFVGVVINGEPRWLEIAGIRFQPSEVAKLCSVCFTALVLSKRNALTDSQMFWTIIAAVGIVCVLIFVNNASTAILLFMVTVMMMFIGQIDFKRMMRLLAVCTAFAALLVAFLFLAPEPVLKLVPRAETWKARIERFFASDDRMEMENRTVSMDDEHYQEDHARMAIARGGVFGQKPGHSVQRDFLPQAYSDFIYAIIIEELGLLGGGFVLFLYLALLFRVGIIARKCDKLFPKYLILGCALLVVTQAIINMAVAVGLFPVTGQPLPLVSRGGTSTLINCAYIGIILSISRFSANIGNEEDGYPEDEEVEEGEAELVEETEAGEKSLNSEAVTIIEDKNL